MTSLKETFEHFLFIFNDVLATELADDDGARVEAMIVCMDLCQKDVNEGERREDENNEDNIRNSILNGILFRWRKW